MPIIEGTIVNLETFQGKEGKAPRKVIQVLETMGKLAELVNVSDMSNEEGRFKKGQMVRLPVASNGYVDRNGAVVLTYTYWGMKNGYNSGVMESDQGAANGKAKANGPDAGAGAVRASI